MLLPFALVTSLGASALAQPKDATARADALFEKGKSELAANRPKQACAAFEESYALDAADGTLLALGLCHEQLGELPRAYNELATVQASAAKTGRDDRQRVAKTALSRIEPKVGRISIKVPGDVGCAAAIDDTKTTVDIQAVTAGTHRVSCSSWSSSIEAPLGQVVVVVVPAAEKPMSAPPLATKPVPPPAEDAAPFPWGYVVGGAGVLSLGVGTVFGVSAFSQWNDVKAKCVPTACSDRSADADASSAKRSALVSNITIGAGVVLLAVGIYLVVTSHHADRSARVAQ